MARPPLHIEVTAKDRKELRKLLSGGVQQVRVVLRAVALSRLAQGVSAPRISSVIPLTPQAIRKVGHRYQQGGLERALYEKERRGAAAVLDDGQKQRIIAMVCSDPPEAARAGLCGWWWKKPSSGDWFHESAGKPSAYCSSTTTSSRGGKKMWCVADLTEDYITKMEDVLETYEQSYDPQQPVVCLDEKPVTRPLSGVRRRNSLGADALVAGALSIRPFQVSRLRLRRALWVFNAVLVPRALC